jgi:hypothetical protein
MSAYILTDASRPEPDALLQQIAATRNALKTELQSALTR